MLHIVENPQINRFVIQKNISILSLKPLWEEFW